jgi:hypothetical protein
MLEIQCVVALLRGVSLEKINLPFFYQLGHHLNPITLMQPEQ